MAEVNIQTVTLSGYKASVQGAQYLRLGTWDSYGIEQLQIVPGPEWTGLVIKAVFVTAAGTTPVVVPDSGLIDVPPEATAQALGVESPGMIVFSGVTAGVQRITCNLLYLVSDHAPIDGTAPDPTPDQWQQYVAAVKQYAEQAQAAADKLPVPAPSDTGKSVVVREDGTYGLAVIQGGGGGIGYRIGHGLKVTGGDTLEVDAADAVERDNTRPVTSAAVYTEVGNIDALLQTI